MDRRITRRALLGAAGLLPLAACTSEPGPPPPPDPDDLLRAAAVERERSLLREYDAVLLVLPDLAPRLLPLRGHHAEHLLELTGAAATPTATASGDPVPAVPPPRTAAAALAGLAQAEREAATGHRAGALEASRPLAALLASLAAAEQAHPVSLA